uniref:Uncharacterized protein n=1 Tax=Anguilla anguilla TaxID=7936 RepID=A0A0E9SBX2_ANGAN
MTYSAQEPASHSTFPSSYCRWLIAPMRFFQLYRRSLSFSRQSRRVLFQQGESETPESL